MQKYSKRNILVSTHPYSSVIFSSPGGKGHCFLPQFSPRLQHADFWLCIFNVCGNLVELAGQEACTAEAGYHLQIIQIISIKKICDSHGVSLSSLACVADTKHIFRYWIFPGWRKMEVALTWHDNLYRQQAREHLGVTLQLPVTEAPIKPGLSDYLVLLLPLPYKFM